MEILQSFEAVLHGIIAGAMIAPVVASVMLGLICIVWTKFN